LLCLIRFLRSSARRILRLFAVQFAGESGKARALCVQGGAFVQQFLRAHTESRVLSIHARGLLGQLRFGAPLLMGTIAERGAFLLQLCAFAIQLCAAVAQCLFARAQFASSTPQLFPLLM
jgi:hypothetical protein